MKRGTIFWGLAVIFFIIYFKLLGFIWDLLLPWNTYTDIMAVFVILFVNIPLSVFSAEKIIKVIKSDKFTE